MPEATTFGENSSPSFFKKDNLVAEVDELIGRFDSAIAYAKQIRNQAFGVLAFEKFFPHAPSPQIVERFFLDNNGELLGYQCVFFDNEVSLTELEKAELRALTFEQLVNSMDRGVLMKLSLVWPDGPDCVPKVIIQSHLMDDSQLHFSRFALEVHKNSSVR